MSCSRGLEFMPGTLHPCPFARRLRSLRREKELHASVCGSSDVDPDDLVDAKPARFILRLLESGETKTSRRPFKLCNGRKDQDEQQMDGADGAQRKEDWADWLRAANRGDVRAYLQFLRDVSLVLRGIVRARGAALGDAVAKRSCRRCSWRFTRSGIPGERIHPCSRGSMRLRDTKLSMPSGSAAGGSICRSRSSPKPCLRPWPRT